MIVAEHSSGLHSVEPDVLRGALIKQLSDRPDVLTLTEMMSEARARVLEGFPGYAVARVVGSDGCDELALMALRSRYRIVSFRAVKLSGLPIPRRSGAFDYALVVVLEDLVTRVQHTRIVVHRPSGVQGDGRVLDNAQGEVYRDGMGGLRRLVASIDGPVVITGDWNLSLRLGWVREYFQRHFPAFTPSWGPGDLPEAGTHGSRVIDFSLVRGFTVAAADVVPSFGASDHRAIRETHKEPHMSATPKTDAFVVALRRRGVEVLTHDQWDSRCRDIYRDRLTSRPHSLLPSKPVDTLWNHITVTLDHGPLTGNFAADLRTVEDIGKDRFGSGISYNILVDQNAPHPRVAIGQFFEAKGAHTVNDKGTAGFSRDQNAVALALAWIGMPGDRLNEHAITATVQANAALMQIGALTQHYDNVPHSLVAPKDCPTDELRARLATIKRDALIALASPPVKPTPRWDDLFEGARLVKARAAQIAATAPADSAAARDAREVLKHVAEILPIARKRSTKF